MLGVRILGFSKTIAFACKLISEISDPVDKWVVLFVLVRTTLFDRLHLEALLNQLYSTVGAVVHGFLIIVVGVIVHYSIFGLPAVLI